ncbi:MAG: hypothetical protein A3F12_05275 [Gammaproteobacteria bacterium RIFCSPHIGHO2_12_FULL_38_14]|nr:MAG: hypothetical protein A3F12_05275 [Gammaproteobacteria bacterium RIFCSPHIGHO2_12_FULL_38_14]
MKLGERFVKNELALAQQIKKALLLQRRTGGQLGEILLAITSMRSLDYYKVLAEHYGLGFVDLLVSKPNLQLLSDEDHDLYLSMLTIPIKNKNDTFTIATAHPSPETINFIKKKWGESTDIVCTAKFDVLSILQDRFHEDYLYESINKLIDSNAAFSAKKTFCTWQVMLIVFVIGMSIYLIIFNSKLFFILFNIFLTISVSVVLIYKVMLSIIAMFIDHQYKEANKKALPKKNLPIYTILVPLYKEKEITLRNLFENIKKIHYPKHKLDVKILLERDDEQTISILKNMHLPSYCEFIYVSPGEPRTKAKACNYGLKFARGEYLTLYDAEDKPDPYQLKTVLNTFLSHQDSHLACIQSRLNFYNSNENWLTRMFTIEYTYWFDLLLPALSYLRTPIPLGGTSNHFKTAILREIDAWDPYNVAEDADLGIRLQYLGYKTKVIASTTYEEANCRLINWIKQRTRWVKGYMQTYLVHMRNPFKLWRAIGVRGFISFQLFVGGTVLSNLCYIILWFIFIASFFLTPSQKAYFFPFHMIEIAYFNFFVGSFGIIVLNLLGIIQRGKYSLALVSITSPIYWLLISIASYRALYQLFFNPSYWDKTEHGISKLLK